MDRSEVGPLSDTSESLARLAEIADVVSKQQHKNTLFTSSAMGSPGHSFGSMAPLRKRPVDMTGLVAGVDSSSKRMKKDDAAADADNQGDVRFREYQAEIWSEKFEDLCEFRRFYGHCHVPHYYQRNAPLAQWVKRQRYQYKLKVDGKRSTLSDERVRLLNKIGFIWNSHDAVWEERWNELLLYKRIHGDCIVPSNYEKNTQLAVWVKRQRRQYKFYCEGKATTSMTKERIAKLEKLGFAWDCRKPKEDSKAKTITPASSSPAITSLATTTAATTAAEPTTTRTASPSQLAKPAALSQSSKIPDIVAPVNAKKSTEAVAVPLLGTYPKCEFFTFGKKFTTFGKFGATKTNASSRV